MRLARRFMNKVPLVQHLQQLSPFLSSLYQPVYTYTDGEWQEQSANYREPIHPYPKIKLLTWNINCKKPCGDARMEKALEYISDVYLDENVARFPLVLFFQEMTASYLDIIQNTPWIRARSQITDIDPSNWASSSAFGTTTLIDRRLAIRSVSRVLLGSSQGRDALFVDVDVGVSSMASSVLVRFCNTHLESFNDDPPVRPGQLALISQHLHAEHLHAGVVAGDLNAIHKRVDSTLHNKNELKDAYLENGGKNRGFTWGMQSAKILVKGWPRRKYPCKRLDKFLFCGNAHVKKPKAVGRGLRIGATRDGAFVSDHLGLIADMRILEI